VAKDAILKIAETAKEAVQGKSEWIEHSARIAEIAVDVVTNFMTEDLTNTCIVVQSAFAERKRAGSSVESLNYS
jgi:hypothetical protein